MPRHFLFLLLKSRHRCDIISERGIYMEKLRYIFRHPIKYIRENKHCFLLLFWPIQTIVYEVTRIMYSDIPDVWMLHCEWDDKIPFCEWFIIPYVMWYFYIASVLFYSLYHGKRQFYRSAFLVIGCTVIPMIFCAIVPNGIEYSMRPDFDALGRDNFAIDLVKLIYASDSPPRNCMPSAHVSVAWAIAAGYCLGESLKKKYVVKILACVLTFLITLSVVFVKQHSVLDIFGGIAVFAIVLPAVLLGEKWYDKRKAKKKSSEA